MTDETGGAVEKARGMYPGKSTLVYGVQWDAVMKWISKDDILAQYLKDSIGKGNYTSNLSPTGSNPEYQIKNIYDMAGNVWEWTMEANYTNLRVRRGGDYTNSGSDFPVAHRNNSLPDNSFPSVGFRVALYV